MIPPPVFQEVKHFQVAYQRDAIMRVVMPEGPNTTNLHCDADYHHPPAEVVNRNYHHDHSQVKLKSNQFSFR